MKPFDPAQTPALEIDRVSHRYGARVALNDVSFAVRQSSFTVLLGLNGAGKSTLFSLITRLYAIRSGQIRIFGHDVGREPGAALSQLGVVFQSRALDIDISVRQNLMYHAALHGIASKRANERIAQVLDRVAMTDRSRDRVGNLSIGQMRRIEIARALLHQPRLLLLDEPTVGLDIKARADILDHVRKLSATEGLGVLWATHLIDEARSTRRCRGSAQRQCACAWAGERSDRPVRRRRPARRIQPVDRESPIRTNWKSAR